MRKTNPLKISDIEIYANNIRKRLGYLPNTAFPILEVIEKFHYEKLLTIQFLEDDNSIFENDTPAKYNPSDNFIYVKESVLEELENCEYRANFTLAHEFFHYLQCQILNFDFEETDECPSFCDPEWQADEFAGQLLLPTEAIINENDSKIIADIYKVSETCLITRKLYYNRRKNRNNKLII